MSCDVSRFANFIIYFSKSRGMFGLFKWFIYFIFCFYYVVRLAIRSFPTFVIFHFVNERKINEQPYESHADIQAHTHAHTNTHNHKWKKKRRMFSFESYHSFAATILYFTVEKSMDVYLLLAIISYGSSFALNLFSSHLYRSELNQVYGYTFPMHSQHNILQFSILLFSNLFESFWVFVQ